MSDLRLLHISQLPPMSSWADSALCAQSDPELWFPEKGGTSSAAIDTCRQCPVATQCLEFALAHERTSMVNVDGVWGGTTAKQRKTMLADLPGLCALCPNERQPQSTYCSRCSAARLEQRQRDYDQRQASA